MRQFTDKDIETIKNNLISLTTQIAKGQEYLFKYVNNKIITDTQQRSIVTFIKQNLKISFEPLPKELIPLIEVVKFEIQESESHNLPRGFFDDHWTRVRSFNDKYTKYKHDPYGYDYYGDYDTAY